MASVRGRRGDPLAHARQPVLPVQFYLHRRLPRARRVFLRPACQIRPPPGSVRRRPLHAALPRRPARGKHADRRVLVLPFFRRVRGGDHPLRGRENLRAAPLRAGLVWVRLLDGDGPGPFALPGPPGAPEKARLCPVHRVRRLSRLCGRPLPAGRRRQGQDPVLELSRRESPLLRGWRRAGVRLPGQPGVLQISLPGYGFFEAGELFFPPARQE